MQRILYTLFFLTLFWVPFSAQIADQENPTIPLPKLDSFLNVLNQHPEEDTAYLKSYLYLVSYLRTKDPDLALQYAENMVLKADNLTDPETRIKAKNMLGICYMGLNQYVNALEAFDQAYLLAVESNSGEYQGTILMNKGIVYKLLNDYPTSIKYYRQAWAIYDSLDSKSSLARVHNNLGNLYSRREDLSAALEQYQLSKRLYALMENKRGYHSAQLNLALLLIKSESYVPAKNLLDSVLTYVVQQDLVSEEVLALNAMGNLLVHTGKYVQGNEYLQSALSKAIELDMKESIFASYTHLARSAALQGRNSEAGDYLDNAEDLSKVLDRPSVYRDLARTKLEVYRHFRQWQDALHQYGEYKYWDDSLNNIEVVAQYNAQQIQFDLAQKNRILESQEREMNWLRERLDFQLKLKWGLIIMSGLLLIIGLLIYNKYLDRKSHAQNMIEKNRVILEQKETLNSKNVQIQELLEMRKIMDQTIYSFASSLTIQEDLKDVFETIIVKSAIELGLHEQALFLFNEMENEFIQAAEYSDQGGQVHLNLPENILLKIQELKQPIIEQSHEKPDSKLYTPLVTQGKQIGFLLSRQREPNYFSDYHQQIMRTIGVIAASKITQVKSYQAFEQAKSAQLEAEKSKELDDLKSTFFANVSHEFRTPLHLIMAPLEKPVAELKDSELAMIKRNSQRLLRLVNQLLDLTRIENNELSMQFKKIEIFGFISEISKTFIPLADRKKVIYQIDIPERDYLTLFDPEYVEKIVYNLLSNAFKFTPENGIITIHLHHNDHQSIEIRVSDNGIGIPEEQMNHIFERFHRVDHSNEIMGTGIGLALTKELVEQMDGTIQVESQLNKGTSFVVRLPFRSIEDDHPVESYAVHQDTSNILLSAEERAIAEPDQSFMEKPTLLIVEDHSEMRSYLKEQLPSFAILEAEHGKRGLELAKRYVPDIVITDYMMPHMDGLQLIKSLRNNPTTSHIPVVLLTARVDSDTRTQGFLTGAEQFLGKPFEIRELKARIKSLLEQRANLRARYKIEPSDLLIPVDNMNKDELFLKELVGIVENNLDNEHFSVQKLQEEAGMSRMQLHRKLKALLDQSSSEFIRTVRLNHAARFLLQPDMQVTEVAYKVGFSHLSYFAKCFKEQFGLLPSEYASSN